MIRLASELVSIVESVRVIRVTLTRGRGTREDRVRTVTQWWTPEGDLIGEVDPVEQYAALDTTNSDFGI